MLLAYVPCLSQRTGLLTQRRPVSCSAARHLRHRPHRRAGWCAVATQQTRRAQLAAKRRDAEPEQEEEDDLEDDLEEEDGLEGELEAAEGQELDGEGLESSSSAAPWQPRRLTLEEMDERLVQGLSRGTMSLEELKEWWATNSE